MASVKLLVGTKKAGFVYSSDEKRQKWEVSEPILPGWSFFHMSADTRDSKPRMYAAANHWAWGPSVAKSEDGGKTWDYNSKDLAFPPDMKEYKEKSDAPPGVERPGRTPKRAGRSVRRDAARGPLPERGLGAIVAAGGEHQPA